MNSNSPHPSRLAFRIRYLRPSPRALAACEALGVDTVGDFCQRSPAEFLGQPNFGKRTWRDLSRRVEQFLDEPGAAADVSGDGLDRPVQQVIRNRRALRACRSLGIRTVGEFLGTTRAELLSVAGFGERTLWEVHRDLAGTSPSEALAEIVPQCLLDLRISELPESARDRIRTDGATRIEELLQQAPSVETRAALKQGLENLVSSMLAMRTRDFSDWLLDARQGMRRPVREVFDRVLGIGRPPSTPAQAATVLRLPQAEATALLAEARQHLTGHEPASLERWSRELDASLQAMGGVVTPATLAAGDALRAATRTTPDPALPLRVVTFCRPDIGHAHHDFTCRLDREALKRLLDALRASLTAGDQPLRFTDLKDRLPDSALPANSDGLLEFLLRHRLHRTLRFDAVHGEILLRAARGIADRLEAILEAEREPMRIDDLLFHYRDRYHRGRRLRLLEALREDGRFLQVGADTWSLRARHIDELELIRPEAERIADEIVASTERRAVFAGRDGSLQASERTAHLLVDQLRREPRLRSLGRGEFCPRRSDGSALVADIVTTLRRAMGEVPFSRFLQNQPPERRRLVARLLRVNRLFVSPSRDRVDLADNYPFTGDRLRILLRIAGECIDISGYAPLAQIHHAVAAAGLAGEFLSEHLLLDILRRHGDFDVLPGLIVADGRLRLGRWIQRMVRQILRGNREGLTPQQVLAERPELAEFATALPELMEQDPLVQSEDGLHYHLV